MSEPVAAPRRMLRSAIEDPRIAWTPSAVPAGSVFHELGDGVLAEIDRNRHLLQEEIAPAGTVPSGGTGTAGEFPELARETAALRRRWLDGGLGFVIVRGLAPAAFSPAETENVFWRVCNLLGVPLSQKAGRVVLGRVENLGRPPGEPVRYHESGTGGSIHTDGPIMPRVPDYVGLLSVRAALEGGRSKFVSIARVHNVLLEEAPGLLEELYRPFDFDRRVPHTEVTEDNPTVLRAPIFTYDPALGARGLGLRWQPEYVWQASRLEGVAPLPVKRQLALHLLEGLLEDRAGDLTVSVTMQPGDFQLVDNHVVAHGRTAFVDPPDPGDPARPDPARRRLLRRVWLRRREGPAGGR